MRTASAFAAAAVITLGLAGCAPTQSNANGCEAPVTSGPASNLIQVAGAAEQAPVVNIPTPLKTEQTQRTVLVEGHGPGLVKGQLIDIDFTVLDGTTGQVQQQGGYTEEAQASSIALNDQTLPGLVNGLLCAQVGSRVAIAIAPADLTNQQNVPAGADTLVAVIDVVRAYPIKANGADQPAQPGFPAVVTNEAGVPGVVIPEAEPPTELMIADIKKGRGDVVDESDTVIAQYTGILWNERTVFDSSWQNGSPAALPAASDQGIIPGFSKALLGHTVGSQVIAIVPSGEAYGQRGVPQAGIPPNATLIFVIDILGIA